MNLYEAIIKSAVKNRDKQYLISQIAIPSNESFWKTFDRIVLGDDDDEE